VSVSLARLSFAAAFTTSAIIACSPGAEDPPGTRCGGQPIEHLKELLVVEEDVLVDGRSKNATAGPWSFRHVMENLAPEAADPAKFTRAWLDEWVGVKELNGLRLDRPSEERDGEMRRRVVCPWLRRTPANACNDDCSTCAGETLDLGSAPFRLIGIANRIDLREEVAEEPNGEGRFIFALTEGPADDPTSRPLPMTVVVEYLLPETRTTKQWAEVWHDLGTFPDFGEPYRAALEAVTRSFSLRGVRPSGINRSALGQIRTNESALNWIWQLREFALAIDGYLRLRPTRNTPIETLNNTPALRDHVLANRDAILSKKYEMPLFMRDGAADQLLYVWNVPGADEPLRKAFASGTCNGCHSTERPNIDTAFHVSPFRSGAGRLSPFLYDPRGGPDELTVRAESARRALCGL
jgi:hypothetical protein